MDVLFFALIIIPIGMGETMQWVRGGMEPVVYIAEARELWVNDEKVVLIGTEYTKKEYTDLQKIADCESGARLADGTAVPFSAKQFKDNGELVTNKNTNTILKRDVGWAQINEYFHLERARSLGINIYSEEGNKRYAKILFHETGGALWSASFDCHRVI